MFLQGVVGKQSLADGAFPNLRAGKSGELMVSELMPRYYELSYRGLLFLASNQAARAISLLSGTATGLILTNPVNSTVNLIIVDVSCALATAPAGAATVGLALGAFSTTAVTHTTPETVRNANGNFATTGATGLVDRAATIPAAPVLIRNLAGPVAASSISPPYIHDDVAGQIILSAGTTISLTVDTTAISSISAFVWAELPL